MSNTFTNDFKTHVAKLFYEDVVNNSNTNIYMFAARSIEFDDDNNPPAPGISIKAAHYDLLEEAIFGKRISSSDVAYMIGDYHWSTGTVYAQYDDQDDDLWSKIFYVIVPVGNEYYIYKCLKNNYGAASTIEPNVLPSVTTDSFVLSDGYEWKCVGSFSSTLYSSFDTESYAPIDLTSTNTLLVEAAAIDGGIETILVETSGTGYNAYVTGSVKQALVDGNALKYYIQSDSDMSANNDYYNESAFYIMTGTGHGQLRKITEYGFEGTDRYILIDSEFTTVPDPGSEFEISPYVSISGDGTGALAKAVVNTSLYSIDDILVVDAGAGYSWADVTITSNTGNLSSAISATARAVISPPGGHCSDPKKELYVSKVGFTSTFDNANLPTTNDYRKFGILKDPLYNSVVITVDTATSFASNETSVVQPSTGAVGDISSVNTTSAEISLTNVRGVFATGNTYPIYGTNNTPETFVTAVDKDCNYFDNRTVIAVNITYGSAFSVDEIVTQANNSAYGYVHEVSGSTLYIVPMKGNFSVSNTESIVGSTSGTTGYIQSITEPDLIRGTGKILYVENMQPITRTNSQSETMKIVIEF